MTSQFFHDNEYITKNINDTIYTRPPPIPSNQKKSSKTKVMDFDTFVLPDGVGKILGLTVVPLAFSNEKTSRLTSGGVSSDPVGSPFFFIKFSLVGWNVRMIPVGWFGNPAFNHYIVEVGSFSHYFMRFFFHPRWLVGSLPSTV